MAKIQDISFVSNTCYKENNNNVGEQSKCDNEIIDLSISGKSDVESIPSDIKTSIESTKMVDTSDKSFTASGLSTYCKLSNIKAPLVSENGYHINRKKLTITDRSLTSVCDANDINSQIDKCYFKSARSLCEGSECSDTNFFDLCMDNTKKYDNTIKGNELSQALKRKCNEPMVKRFKKVCSIPKDVFSLKTYVTEENYDYFCWNCHKDGKVIRCVACPRVYHLSCIQLMIEPGANWLCIECESILLAESSMFVEDFLHYKVTSFGLVKNLLRHVIQLMRNVPDSKPLHKPVDTLHLADYCDYIVHPMDLSSLEELVNQQEYCASLEAFHAEARWMLHNCIVYNGLHSELTSVAQTMLAVCEEQIAEIKRCPDCYQNKMLSTGDEKKKQMWFALLCQPVHPLVWVKMLGKPEWPAKVFCETGNAEVEVDLFGTHERLTVSCDSLSLLSCGDLLDGETLQLVDADELGLALHEFQCHLGRLKERFEKLNLPTTRQVYKRELAHSLFGSLIASSALANDKRYVLDSFYKKKETHLQSIVIDDCETSVRRVDEARVVVATELSVNIFQTAIYSIKKEVLSKITPLLDDMFSRIGSHFFDKLFKATGHTMGLTTTAAATDLKERTKHFSKQQLTKIQAELSLERQLTAHRINLFQARRNADLTLIEMVEAHELEKNRLLVEAAYFFENEMQRRIDETKENQWCAFCQNEAYFYCCWNTWYCKASCQQKHWAKHILTCGQVNRLISSSRATTSFLCLPMSSNGGGSATCDKSNSHSF